MPTIRQKEEMKIETLLLCDSLAGLSWACRSIAPGFSLAGLS